MQVVENLKSRLPARVASTIERLDRKGFGTVTVHWITSNWSMEEAVLGAKSLDCVIGFNDEDHEWEVPREDAANVAEFYTGLLEEFNCTGHSNTTDSPSVMESFRRLLQQGILLFYKVTLIYTIFLISLGAGVQGMRCLAHCLHNVIKKACATPLIERDFKLLRTLCKEI